MPYIFANKTFSTKSQLTDRCREIMAATTDGSLVSEESLSFLLELFQHHDEWLQKAGSGVRGVSTQTTAHGTRCFVLLRKDGSSIDISFPHAIRLVPSRRTANLLPQALRDFRNAARTAVEAQIRDFRDLQLNQLQSCPITGDVLRRDNCAVDHVPPDTFDAILLDFCQKHLVNPLTVAIGSAGGTVAVFEDKELLANWQAHHQDKAVLRLLSKIGNTQLPKTRVAWKLVCS